MKFDIGYFFKDEFGQPFSSIIDDFGAQINSVYFPWIFVDTGRAHINKSGGYVDWTAQERLVSDLKYIHSHNIKLDLLINGNCYGAKAISKEFATTVSSIIDYIEQNVGSLDSVTTTSPFVAWIVKQRYPHIKTKASVNMRVGTIYGMEQLRDHFDQFLVQRDFNRDLNHLKQLIQWGEQNGKEMRILANSGCMRLCSGQIFHDNLCSHDSEIQSVINESGVPISLCNYVYDNPSNRYKFLQNTWIRPEDLSHYEDLFTSVKLATRTVMQPRQIIKSYCDGSFRGNLLELFEPNHVLLFFPTMIRNEKFPEDWFEKTSTCGQHCENCNYCKQVYEQVTAPIFSI